MTIRIIDVCPLCLMHGAVDGAECPACKGRGALSLSPVFEWEHVGSTILAVFADPARWPAEA